MKGASCWAMPGVAGHPRDPDRRLPPCSQVQLRIRRRLSARRCHGQPDPAMSRRANHVVGPRHRIGATCHRLHHHDDGSDWLARRRRAAHQRTCDWSCYCPPTARRSTRPNTSDERCARTPSAIRSLLAWSPPTRPFAKACDHLSQTRSECRISLGSIGQFLYA